MGFSRLTIFGCLTIATFEPTRTTTIFDTKQPSLTEKSTENEGLSPVTTRCLRATGLMNLALRLRSASSCVSRYRPLCFTRQLAVQLLDLFSAKEKGTLLRSPSFCGRQDLNLHISRYQILNLARLPFRHARVR